MVNVYFKFKYRNIYPSPYEDPNIKKEELDLYSDDDLSNPNDLSAIINKPIPWRIFYTNPSVLAMYNNNNNNRYAVHFCHGYGENTLV